MGWIFFFILLVLSGFARALLPLWACIAMGLAGVGILGLRQPGTEEPGLTTIGFILAFCGIAATVFHLLSGAPACPIEGGLYGTYRDC